MQSRVVLVIRKEGMIRKAVKRRNQKRKNQKLKREKNLKKEE